MLEHKCAREKLFFSLSVDIVVGRHGNRVVKRFDLQSQATYRRWQHTGIAPCSIWPLQGFLVSLKKARAVF